VTATAISEALTRFIGQHIHSVLQLEILLLLRATDADFTPASLAKELRISEQSAEIRLKDLQLRGLISAGGTPNSYRYGPHAAELEALVDELARCYMDAKYTVINLIFSQPGDTARSLAEAFRFRKKRDE
jgi:hypothetical protein